MTQLINNNITGKPSAPLIRFNRISKFFKPDHPALFDVSLDIEQGEFIYIAGTSGAGKSTLLGLIHLSLFPDTGALLFNGHDVSSLKHSAISVLRRSMGIIFQDFLLIDELSVAANIGLSLEVTGVSPLFINQRIKEVLDAVDLKGIENEIAGTLSGGEKQRVAIARALAPEPQLILADEPTGSLDTYSANFVLDMLEKVNEQGATVLVATHDRMLMAARPHRTVALENGKIVGMTTQGAFKTRNRNTSFKQIG
jgi:cell division transport system ATP-binding protein